MKDTQRVIGLTFFDGLCLLFIAFKLLGIITWSWWWVLAPLWIPVTIGLLVIAIVLIVNGVKRD